MANENLVCNNGGRNIKSHDVSSVRQHLQYPLCRIPFSMSDVSYRQLTLLYQHCSLIYVGNNTEESILNHVVNLTPLKPPSIIVHLCKG